MRQGSLRSHYPPLQRAVPPKAAHPQFSAHHPARLHHTDTCWSLQTLFAKTALSVRKSLLEEIVSLKYPYFSKQLIGSVQILSKHEWGVPRRLSWSDVCLQLSSWSQDRGIKPHVGLSAQRGVGFSPTPSLLSLSLKTKTNTHNIFHKRKNR